MKTGQYMLISRYGIQYGNGTPTIYDMTQGLDIMTEMVCCGMQYVHRRQYAVRAWCCNESSARGQHCQLRVFVSWESVVRILTLVTMTCFLGGCVALLIFVSAASGSQLRGSTLRKQISSAILSTSILFTSMEACTASSKSTNLQPSSIATIVAADITERQALITADFTRDIYSESCTFQDEIDTYPIDKYVSGTKALFNKDKSHVDLVGDVIATPESVEFRFSEVLAFNVPFNPRVSLTGKVKLTRGSDGLIVSSREFWDQSVPAVLATVKF